MKTIIALLLISVMLWMGCSSKTHASKADKKKVKDYNSIQYKGAKKKG